MKIYEAAYSDCIYESAFGCISLHKTKEGAERAIKNHRRRLVKQNKNQFVEMQKIDPTLMQEPQKIEHWQQWTIVEHELKD